MRVALDLTPVLRERPSGFFTYGAGLLQGFATLDQPPKLTLLAEPRALRNRHWLDNLPDTLHRSWRSTHLKSRHLLACWRHLHFPALQRLAGDFDLYHCIHQLIGPARNRPRLLTVHDLRRYRYPDFYPNSRLAPWEHAVRNADHFLAISESTRRDLQEFFDIPDHRIDVVYHGGPLHTPPAHEPCTPADPAPDALKRLGLKPATYFVTFSSYDRRKNIPTTVRAFARAAQGLPADFRLLVLGRTPPDLPALLAEETAAADRLVCPGPINDLADILRCATALVYASLYEGFGLPILEAMAAGAAVITSNASSMPEIAADAALLVDPHQPDQLADAMLNLARDPDLRSRLIQAGRLRAAQFSWPKAAAETLAVYQKLLT